MKQFLRRHWDNVSQLLSKLNLHDAIAAVVLTLLFIFTTCTGWAFVIGLTLWTLFAVRVGIIQHRNYVEKLRARIQSNNADRWVVRINRSNGYDKKVGVLSDADYAKILLRVYTNHDLYKDQVRNVVSILSRFLVMYFIRFIPLAALAFPLVALYLTPDETAQMLWAAWGSPEGTADLFKAFDSFIDLIINSWFIVLCIMFACARRTLGFANRFDDAVAGAIEDHFGVTTCSTITMEKKLSLGEADNPNPVTPSA